jgi:pimeloyl-ACP methyl ester carboxylesterase
MFMKNIIILLFVTLFAFVSKNVFSSEVSIALKEGVNGLADYSEGVEDKPAVFLLHGILQTREFSTIQLIGDYLKEEGYTTLIPNLSLGIDGRVQSLACEAIHTHSMQMDAEEIYLWYKWLREKSGKPVVFIGHSAGATQMLAFIDAYRDEIQSPEKLILISLAYFSDQPNSKTDPDSIARARKALAKGDDSLGEYGFVYCDKYVTLPSFYLSYIDWNKDRVTQMLSQTGSSVSLLFGSGDKRIDQQWPSFLQENNFNVTIVEGADHFFHQQHEFDLVDYIEQELKN